MKSLKLEFRGCAVIFDVVVKSKAGEVVNLLPSSRIEGLILYLLGHSLPVSEIIKLKPSEVELARSIMSKMIVTNVSIKTQSSIPSFGQGKMINKTPTANRQSGSTPSHILEEMFTDKMRIYWNVVKEVMPDLDVNKMNEKGTGGFDTFNRLFTWPDGHSKESPIYKSYARCAGIEKEDQTEYPAEYGEVNAILFNRMFTEGSQENLNLVNDPSFYGLSFFVNGGSSTWLKSSLPHSNRIIVKGSMAYKYQYDFDIVFDELDEIEMRRLLAGPMIGLYSEGSAMLSHHEILGDINDERESLIVPNIFRRN